MELQQCYQKWTIKLHISVYIKLPTYILGNETMIRADHKSNIIFTKMQIKPWETDKMGINVTRIQLNMGVYNW